MHISEAIQQTIVVYPGRFHPFHKGHASVYKHLKSKYKTVYIATSNKVDPPKSPFNFAEKRAMMLHAGIPADAIVQTKSPYRADEITSQYDPETTVLIFAISEKDMAENPRFSFGPKKDGSPSYFQPLSDKLETLDKHGYITTVPTLDFTVLGKPMRSATKFRRNFTQADEETQAEMIKDMYGSYSKEIHDIMSGRITEIMSFVPGEGYSSGEHKLRAPRGTRVTTKSDPYYGHSVFGGNKGVVVKAYKRLNNVIDGLKELDAQKPIDKETKQHVLQQIGAIREKLSQLQVESKLVERWKNKKKKKTKKKHRVWKRVKEAENQTMWDFLYRQNGGKFWRGVGSTGQGHGLGALGKGVYLSWEEGMAQAFAGDGEVKQYKVKQGLNIVDVEDKDFIDVKAQMGFQPWEYSNDPMYAGMLTIMLKDKGYDGAVSDEVATGIVIFDESNVTKLTIPESTELKVQKRLDGFTLDMWTNNNHVGQYTHTRKDDEVRNFAEIFPEYRNKGYGSMLLLAAIKTAGDAGMDFEEDSHSLTPAMSRLYDELYSSGLIYGGSGSWAISPSGKSELKDWLSEDIKPAVPGKLGDCFSVAGRAMLDLEDEMEAAGFKMVHALVNGEGELEGHRFFHAFNKIGDVIFDNSNGNKIMTRKENYFKQGSINPNEKGAYVEYNKEQSLLNIVKHGHWGPWDLDESLMEEIPNDPAEVGKRHVSISHNELDKAKNELGGLKEYKIEVPVDKKFNMPRSKMPQVHIDDYPEFFDYLSNAGAVFSKEKVSPKTLKPVQGEFAEKGVIKSIKKLKLEKPVIVSSDNYIIDGHHRWLAALNVNQKVLIYRVSLGANKLMQLVLDFPKTYFKDIYEIATHEVRSKTRSGKRYIDVYLPQGGEDGVMLLRWAGQPDWYKRVELRGTPYTKRPEDSDELWDMFDKLYPSKSSALMADEVTTIGPGQGVYSYGYDDLLKLMTEDITKLREDGVSNYKPKVFVDMDGVLANFFDEWEKLLDVGNWRDIKDPIEALKVLAGTDFFATLPKFPGKTDELVTFVHGITNGNWYILSAPLRWDHKGSIKHKQEWLSKNLPIQPKDAIFTGMKESYAIDKMTGQPNILIDDHSKYIKRWVAKGGIAIQYKAGSDSVEKVKQFLEDQLGTMRKDVEDVEIKEAKVLKEKRIGKITKKKYMVSKRDAVVQKMLSSNISLRNVHAAAEYIDNVIKELTSKTGWTDRKGETHYGHDMYIGKLGIWPPTTQPMIGTPDPYSRNKFKQLMASTQANESAAGIITKQNTTAEVKPGEEERQAAKLGWKLDKNGRPPLLHKTAAKNSDPNTLFNIGLAS